MTEIKRPILNDIEVLKDLVYNLDQDRKLARIGINPNSTIPTERSFFDFSLLGPGKKHRNVLFQELDKANEVVMYNRKNEKDVIFRRPR